MLRYVSGFVLLLGVVAPCAKAAESYDACAGFIDSLPATITTQGVWCLRQDLSTQLATGVAIEVATNNVTIDCNGFKVGGLAAGPSTQTTGIHAESRRNTVVRGCAIRGFREGVVLRYAYGSVVEDNLVEASVSVGLLVVGDANVVRRNRILDTGAPAAGNSPRGISTSGSVDIVDNTIDGVEGEYVTGIQAAFGTGATVQDNRVRNLAGNSSSTAIYTYYSLGILIRDNQLAGPAGTGISCYQGEGLVVRNLISQFNVSTYQCQGSGNSVQLPPA